MTLNTNGTAADPQHLGDGLSISSADVLYMPNAPEEIVRTVQQRLRDCVSLNDYVKTPVDGSAHPTNTTSSLP